MKVILTQFVKGLGREGDIVDVSDGYAVNLLFPRGLAKQATASIINQQKMAQKSAQIREEKERKATLSVLKKLDGKTISFQEKLNEKGSLYHALGVKEIARAIREQYSCEVSNTLFKEKYSFKESGKYSIELEAYGKVIKMIVLIEDK